MREARVRALDHAETGKFLRELTELSRRFRLGIAGPVTLFLMEEDDFDRAYRCEDDDRIEFV
jgi:hypothetical protein